MHHRLELVSLLSVSAMDYFLITMIIKKKRHISPTEISLSPRGLKKKRVIGKMSPVQLLNEHQPQIASAEA